MNDKQIAALFMSKLLPAIQATPGLSDVKLARNFQSRQQGANNSKYVYFVKIGDHRYGHVERKEVWNPQTFLYDHQERQKYETTYQFSAWVPQDPTNINGLTESDVLNEISGIIQSDEIRAAFLSAGLGILRVTDVRNPYIVDERDQFEAVPTFDIVLTHDRIRVTTTPAVATQEFNIGRV